MKYYAVMPVFIPKFRTNAQAVRDFYYFMKKNRLERVENTDIYLLERGNGVLVQLLTLVSELQKFIEYIEHIYIFESGPINDFTGVLQENKDCTPVV